MNIVLLSGGSGKRLWPLSNDIRSKQFIKIFKKEDGTYERIGEYDAQILRKGICKALDVALPECFADFKAAPEDNCTKRPIGFCAGCPHRGIYHEISKYNGKIVATSNDLTKATYRLARGMCKKDSSFVTIISGCDVSDEDAEKVTEIVKAKCPNHVEVSHIRGGQPVYYYMISVE